MLRKITIIVTMAAALQGLAYAGVANSSGNLVLGQPDFTASASGAGTSGLNSPHAVAVDETRNRVFVADASNNRVMWWNTVAGLSNGMPADGVLGQADFIVTLANRGGSPTAGTLRSPFGLWVDANGDLWVADSGNNRILRFSGAALASGMNADLVLGQTGFSSDTQNAGGVSGSTLWWPTGVRVDPSGNVWVADNSNHRVLRFSGPTFVNGQAADIVIGQASLTSNISRDTNGDGVAEVITAATLYNPQNICFDAAGNLWVCDHQNHRFLRFNAPFVTGMDASLVLGQADFTHGQGNRGGGATSSSVKCAYGMGVDVAGNIWAADYTNNRVLRFSPPLSNGMRATQVIGQIDFSSSMSNRGVAAGTNTFYHPNYVFADSSGNLWISEGGSSSHPGGNNRVVKFNALKIIPFVTQTWRNNYPQVLSVTGTGMTSDMAVKLVRSGQRDIAGTGVAVVGDSLMTGTFDVSGAAAGSWDLEMTANGLTSTLPNAVNLVTLELSSITPDSVVNTGPAAITISGHHLWQGTVLSIVKQGHPAIVATDVVVSGGESEIIATLPVTDAWTGRWDVKISSGGASAVMANAFAIHFPTATVRHLIERTKSYRIGFETDQGETALEIPAFTFSQDVYFSMYEPSVLPACVNQPEFKVCDIGAFLENEQNLPPLKAMTMTVTYVDSYAAGLDKGRFIISYYDPALSRWLQVDSRATASSNIVAGQVRGMGTFRVLQRVPSNDLAGVAVFPNPYRPGSASPYGDGLLGHGIAFSGLTGRVRIRIFTAAGEEVADITDDNSTGIYVWNTDNEQGNKAASGVYLYLITSPDNGSQKAKGRFSIIR